MKEIDISPAALIFETPQLFLAIVLVLAVIFVNGWTDAPNSIAACISAKSMSPRSAIAMAAVFNFLGTLVMTLISGRVAETLYRIANFNPAPSADNGNPAMTALCSGLASIVIWAVAAWKFGIPTSESHALIAGVTGSAIAMGGLSSINTGEWIKVLKGLFQSVFLGFVIGYILTKCLWLVFKRADRLRAESFFAKAQIAGAAGMSFMHGAQDGQKFIGVFVLVIAVYHNQTEAKIDKVPIWLIMLISVFIAAGTSMGGQRIIKSVGMDMTKLSRLQGFSADFSGSICLLFSTLAGNPVSTTHAKTAAIMGAGAAKSFRSVNWGLAKEMCVAWLLTFPGCGLIAYILTKLSMFF